MRQFWLLIVLLSAWHSAHAEVALPMTQVADGVYVHVGVTALPDTHNHGAIANIGFIVGQRCVAVVDTGGNPQQGRALKQAIVQTTDKPICYVINTHVHPDHIYGNRAFKEGKVQFVGHHKLARAMANRADYYLAKAEQQLGISVSAADIIPPDIQVNDTLKLDLGGRVLTLTAHPTAHTDNDLSVYDAQTNTAWLADLVFVTHLPVIDGSIKGWLHELLSLEKNHYTTVIPGHGAVDKAWPKSMQPEKIYLQSLLAKVREALKQGQFLEAAVASIKAELPEQWALISEFHRKNVTTVFAELEWEETH